MPLLDPRQRPALDVARPGDFTGVRRELVPGPEPWSIRFGGEDNWQDASVISRWFQPGPGGREIVEVEWSDGGILRTETFFAVGSMMRKRW